MAIIGDKTSIIIEMEKGKDDKKMHNIFIRIPKEQVEITASDICHILISAVSLLIKQSPKDAELMKSVVDHLNEEFASSDETYKPTYYSNTDSFKKINDVDNNDNETEK